MALWLRHGAQHDCRRLFFALLALQARALAIRSYEVRGGVKALRAASAALRLAQPSMWSLTRPMGCIKAYIVVGPTKVPPRFLKSLSKRVDADAVGIAFTASCVMRAGRLLAWGSSRQTNAPSEPNSF